jgi:Na+-driven multidrug efflux pump
VALAAARNPIENLSIVAASGLAPAAVASIGQALGDDSLKVAKRHANAALRLGLRLVCSYTGAASRLHQLSNILLRQWPGSPSVALPKVTAR